MPSEQRTAVLETIKAILRERYVFPDAVPAMVDRIDAGIRSGRYDVESPGVFADLVGADLRDAGADEHLGLRHDPAAYAAALAPSGRGDDSAAVDRRRAIRNHHGLVEQRMLDGNVRYLRIAGFDWVPDVTGAAYDAAARFLRDADAIIIDLRGNGGGDSAAVQYLTSHFLDPEALEMTYLEGGVPPMQSRSLAYVPAGRLTGIPLYVLIDSGTASAGEAFAYHAQHFGFGTLVGEPTPGAANNNALLPVAPAFVASISIGRPEHPVTGTNWEGVGIPPAVAAPAAEALDVALALALERLAASDVSEELRAEYVWAKLTVAARRFPPAVDPAELASHAGGYRAAEVTVRDGHLWLARPGRRESRLIPLQATGSYAVAGSDSLRVRFEPDRLLLDMRGVIEPQIHPRESTLES